MGIFSKPGSACRVGDSAMSPQQGVNHAGIPIVSSIEDIGDLSYSELQHHCKLRGLSAGGKAVHMRRRLIDHLRKEEKPMDEATAAEKARMIEQERRFQEEAELQRQEQLKPGSRTGRC